MVVGENGVLNRATDATSKTAKAQAKEALSMAVSGLQGLYADKIADGTSQSQTFIAYIVASGKAGLQAQLSGYTITEDGFDGSGPITVKMTQTGETEPVWTFKITQSGSIGATVTE